MMSALTEPRLGIFWFAGPLGPGEMPRVEQPQLLAVTTPASAVPLIGGFKTTDLGHIDVWPSLQRQHAFLRGRPYEFFPRGRVNYLADSDTYLVLLDPEVARSDFLELIDARFGLPTSRRVMTDSHYRTRVKCRLPSSRAAKIN